MSDHVLILIKNGDDYCQVGCYMQWMGSAALSLIESALPRMQRRDAMLSMARLIGTCHEVIEGNKGLGVNSLPEIGAGESGLPPVEKDSAWEDISPGDAGIVVYDCTSGIVECHAGYLENNNDNRTCIGIPPK